MSLLNKDIITPDEASAIVLGAYQTTTAALPFASILPDQFTGLSVEWTPNQDDPEVDEMKFSTWDAEAPYGRTVGGEKLSYTSMLPLRKRMRVSEKDIANGTISMTNGDLKTTLSDYFVQLGKELAYRLEKARVAVAVDAKLGIKESNEEANWDYARDSALTTSLTATKTWDKSGDPVKDLRTWSDLIDDKKGARPTIMVTTRKVVNALTSNAAIINYLFRGQGSTLPALVSENDVKSVLSLYTGIQDIYVVDERYRDFARQSKITLPGGVKSFFPENTILLIPAFGDVNMGYTALGPTAEAQTPAYGISREKNAGPIGAVLNTPSSTPGYEAYVNGTALPVLVQSNSTLKATVLTA